MNTVYWHFQAHYPFIAWSQVLGITKPLGIWMGAPRVKPWEPDHRKQWIQKDNSPKGHILIFMATSSEVVISYHTPKQRQLQLLVLGICLTDLFCNLFMWFIYLEPGITVCNALYRKDEMHVLYLCTALDYLCCEVPSNPVILQWRDFLWWGMKISTKIFQVHLDVASSWETSSPTAQ